jgi:hypothetical protein
MENRMQKPIICPKCCKPNYYSFHESKKHRHIVCKFCEHKFLNSDFEGSKTEDE